MPCRRCCISSRRERAAKRSIRITSTCGRSRGPVWPPGSRSMRATRTMAACKWCPVATAGRCSAPPPADTRVSFTDVTVPRWQGQPVQPVVMAAGDVLCFNGALVHGSYPNTSAERFRRALIGHYIEGRAEQVAAFYQPALRMDGSALTLETSAGGRWRVRRMGRRGGKATGADDRAGGGRAETRVAPQARSGGRRP
jgi:hypothetical protein